MILNEQQQKIIETKKSKIIVLSCAASGKTRLLTERIKYLLENGVKEEDIVAITFTNMAAEEMRRRIGNYPNLFIGTIHSYANYLLVNKGISTTNLINDENFDGFFKLIKQNPNCIKRVEHLLLDEAQDSTEEQFEFILNMIKPKNYFIVGDHRQSIYSFSGSRPDILINLCHQEDVSVYKLDKNYRNDYNILEFARYFLEPLGEMYHDNSIVMSEYDGQVVRTEYDIDKLCHAIRSKDGYRDWFILARTNRQVEEILDDLEDRDIPCVSFKKSEFKNLTELTKKMEENSVKVLTIHTSKGLETKNVIVRGARNYNAEERRISYVAATRAKELLIWTKEKPKHKRNRSVNWE